MSGLEGAGVVLGMVDVLNHVQGRIDDASRLHRIVDGREWKEDVDQIKIMRAILTDTGKQFLASNPSIACIQDVLCDCQRRLSDLAPLFGVDMWKWNERADTDDFKHLAKAPKYKLLVMDAQRRRKALKSFRESVVLLHQLSSAASMSEKLQHLNDAIRSGDFQPSATTPAAGFTNQSFQSNRVETDEIELHPLLPYQSGISLAKYMSDAKAGHQEPSHITPSRGFLWDLLEQNFTFDAIISVMHSTDKFSVTPAKAMQPKTPIRAIMDTGAAADAFMIHRKVISRAGLDDHIRVAKDPIVFDGLNKATYPCTRCIRITWYVPKHMNSREDVFYVVEDGPFDILIPNIFEIGTRNVEELCTPRDGRSRKRSDGGPLLFIGKRWRWHKEKKRAKIEYKEQQERERRKELTDARATQPLSLMAPAPGATQPAVPTLAGAVPPNATTSIASPTSGQLQISVPITVASTPPQGSIASISRANTPVSSALPSGPSSVTTTNSNQASGPTTGPLQNGATKPTNQAAMGIQGQIPLRNGSVGPQLPP